MRISQIAIRNFKSLKEVHLTIPMSSPSREASADFVSIVGENNAGKSSILNAIILSISGNSKALPEDFPSKGNTAGPIEVELEFNNLSTKDREAPAVLNHTFQKNGEETYRVKKRWSSPGSAPEVFTYNPNGKSYAFIEPWPELPKNDLRDLSPAWRALVEAADRASPPITRPHKEKYLDIAISTNSTLIKEIPHDPWKQIPGGQVSLDLLIPAPIYVPAIRDTGLETDTNKGKSTIRKIVGTLFETQLASNERVVRFKKAAAELEHLFSKESKNEFVTHIEARITEKLKSLIDIEAQLYFTAPNVSADLAGRTEFKVQDGDISTRPEGQGHGAQRSIVLALLQLYAEQAREQMPDAHQPTLFLVEEPEIYLHPEMCRKMRDTLVGIARSGVAQVICTTHSPVFLDLADRHDGIAILRKSDGVPLITQRTTDVFDAEGSVADARARLRMLLDFDPTVNEVFFSRSVCLVEGDSELAALDAIAHKLKEAGMIDWAPYLIARRSTAIINCRGKWTIAAFQKVLREFKIPHRVIHDSDSERLDEGANQRIREYLGSPTEALVHRPNFEAELFNGTWPKDKPWRCVRAVNALSSIQDHPKIIQFFEFILGRPISQLKRVELNQPAKVLTLTSTESRARRPRPNELKQIKMSDLPAEQVHSLAHTIKLAAGPNRIAEEDPGTRLHAALHSSSKIFARVSGDSMADTLQHGDIVELEPLQSIVLSPVNDENAKVPLETLKQHVQNDGIYVIAKNDQIDQGLYTIKRLRIRQLESNGWFGQICADNPNTEWGNRGREDILSTDRVHFAYKVTGIVLPEDNNEAAQSE
ncbi:AAA family ATPase [Myxococcus sp. 1LA]